MSNKSEDIISKDYFQSKFGFIISCAGSAIGMANIWAFPYRVVQFGGGVFLLIYIFFVFLIGYFGLVGEISLGRAFGSGPVLAFKSAFKFKNKEKLGEFLGFIPVFGAFAIALGYSVVMGWLFKYLAGSITGSVINNSDSGAYFSQISGEFKSIPWHFIAIFFTLLIMAFGVSKGIEKINKIFMPIFFVVFIALAINSFFLKDSFKAYEFMFSFNLEYFFNLKTWVYALGQAFFSISLAGSGAVVYGSYLKKDISIFSSAKSIVIFDTIAALLSALIILPAVFSFNFSQSSGPVLLFITVPDIFKLMPLGNIISFIFFLAVLLAGITSLINLLEVPIESLTKKFNIARKNCIIIIFFLCFGIGIFLEGGFLSNWMDIISIYIVPLGALLAGFTFFWICSDKFIKENSFCKTDRINYKFFIFMSRYVFCIFCLIIYIFGIFYGGIG